MCPLERVSVSDDRAQRPGAKEYDGVSFLCTVSFKCTRPSSPGHSYDLLDKVFKGSSLRLGVRGRALHGRKDGFEV